jgi:hypothetical protein
MKKFWIFMSKLKKTLSYKGFGINSDHLKMEIQKKVGIIVLQDKCAFNYIMDIYTSVVYQHI